MLSLREEAIEFIKTVPDDKIVYVMDMFRGIKGFISDNIKEDKQAQQSLLEEIRGLRGIIRSDIDEKMELELARDEKYANFG